MKRIIFFLFLTLFAVLTVSAQCELIDETISLARQEVNRGNINVALSYLRAAQAEQDLRSCSDYSRLADEIYRIESRQSSSSGTSSGSSAAGQNLTITAAMAQDVCVVIDTVIQETRTLVNQGNTSRALNMLKRAQNIPELKECPDYSRLAEEIRRIEAQQQTSSSGTSSSSRTGQNLTITVNGVTFTMVAVQGGTFTMGATSEQGSDAYSDEKPAHSVTLSDYYIGQTEVTQALWQAVMGSNPSNWKGDNLPVEEVSWNDCQQFITKLNQLTGRKFRLPTEAEWEYAARGGNKSRGYKYAGSNEIGSVAWYRDNSGSKTHPVAQKQANELGIYDMAGNVLEWCQDWYDSGYYGKSPSTNPCDNTSASNRVLRGGGWYAGTRGCRVSNRNGDHPGYRNSYLGLRLAL